MIIIGAKGFAKEVLEVIFQSALAEEEIFFFDNVSSGLPKKLYDRFHILQSMDEVKELCKSSSKFLLGIGGTTLRNKLASDFKQVGGTLETLISPYAQIGHFSTLIGAGCSIMTGVVITNDVQIGEGTLVNLNATIGHDTKVGAYCDIMPGVNISGNVSIGDFCNIGTGSVILPKVKIGNYVTVGAGAVVNKDVPDNTTVIGIPAKPMNK